MPRGVLIVGVLLLALAAAAWAALREGASSEDKSDFAGKTLHLPMVTDGPKSLDPVQGSSLYDNYAGSQIYETLLQYKYLVRPPELEPLLLSEMPTVSEDGRTWRFKLRKGIHFQDDPCFPDGKGRELVADDVFYSWKRMADKKNSPKGWWLLADTIEGFDEFRDAQNKAATFDYAAPVSGMRKIDDHEFEIVLKQRIQRFIWVLAMYQLAIVPQEAAEQYGPKFSRHPIGTGPFTLAEDDWLPGQQMTFHKNPNYHASFYPSEHMPEDRQSGLDKAAGTRLPIVDRVEIRMYNENQPRWLRFLNGKLDYIGVPSEYFTEAYIKRLRRLRPSFKAQGITSQSVKSLDFIFIGFNMTDELVGGYSEKQKQLRQAISLAVDWREWNETFENGLNVVYDGPIPPGLDGYPPNGVAPKSYRGANLKRARELLASAGYPEGQGLPPLEFYTGNSTKAKEVQEMLSRHLARIGVRINSNLVDFSTLLEALNNKKAQIFSYAWISDYPDAENNLALFYGPNKTPGNNHFIYERPEFDELYRQIRALPPSPERTRLYEQMRDRLIEDAPFVGSMARETFVLVHPRLKNFKYSEDGFNWLKYLDVYD